MLLKDREPTLESSNGRTLKKLLMATGSGDRPSGQPDWNGLLKWSLKHTDGTQSARQLSDEDRQWFSEAMQAGSVDIVQRMKEITFVLQTPKQVLQEQGVSSQDVEGVLEELQEHVELIDMANDLHVIGGVPPLAQLLKDDYAPIRSKAAEVISTMVQNNPESQKNVMSSTNVLENLVNNFASDPDVTVRTKALGAISSLIRGNKPATAAFRLANGFSNLKSALASDDQKFQRKALQVTQYLLRENPKDAVVAAELGFPQLLTRLASSSDMDMREASLRTLVEIASNETAVVSAWGSCGPGLKEFVEKRIKCVQEMNAEDMASITEERALLDSLWQTFSGEPSALRKDGLVILPTDNQLPPSPPPPPPPPTQHANDSQPTPPLLLKM